MFTDNIYKWLDTCLDYGITENDFWNMTFGELERLLLSKKRIEKQQLQEKASFDYILADIVGKSMARLYSSNNNIPSIEEVYPSLFDSVEIQEQKQEKKDEVSAIRFKQFAQSFNKKFRGGVNNE